MNNNYNNNKSIDNDGNDNNITSLILVNNVFHIVLERVYWIVANNS